MILSTLSFVTGVILVQQFASLPPPLWLFTALVIALICACFRCWRLTFFLSGLVWAGFFADQYLDDRLPGQLEGLDLSVAGQITGLPQKYNGLTRFNFLPDANQLYEGYRLPSKIRLSWYTPKTVIRAGQQWILKVRLKRPHGVLNPAGFDYEKWLFIRKIGATGYVRPGSELLQPGMAEDVTIFSRWRQNLSIQLGKVLKGSDTRGIIKAVVIGDKYDIKPEQWALLRETGTVHLVAISGLHIGLIAGLVYFLVLKCWAYTGILRFSPQVIAAILGLLAGFFYAALAGFSIPTVRALLMLAVSMIAIIWQRNIRPFHVLALALFTVLVFDPMAVLSPGFWLSFTAVALIIYSLAARRVIPVYWRTLLKINWVTSIGLAPLLLFYFQQVSLIAPLANFIAVPVMSFIVIPLSLIATLVIQLLPVLGGWLFNAVIYSFQLLYSVLERLAELPYASVQGPSHQMGLILLAMIAVFLGLAPRGIPCRWMAALLLLPMVFNEPEKTDPGTFKMTLLDVGQGLAAVVQTNSHALIFDAGAKYPSGRDMGESVVLPFLMSLGLDKVDMLVVSHGDIDHLGGVQSIVEGINTERVISSVPREIKSVSAIPCIQGQHWQWDNVTFEMLSPPVPAFSSENDNSCVLKIESEYGSVLLTGDIEKTAEAWLVADYGQVLQSDIMVAPHHGSNSSSSIEFLTGVDPDYVLIPAGYRNRFGHPDQRVLSRYHRQGLKWNNTAYDGAIEIFVGPPEIRVNTFRQSHQNYWQWNGKYEH